MKKVLCTVYRGHKACCEGFKKMTEESRNVNFTVTSVRFCHSGPLYPPRLSAQVFIGSGARSESTLPRMAPPDTFKSSTFKRKLNTKLLASRKRAKIQHHNADDLPWKAVSRPVQTGLSGDDGILELEEVDGVEVVYENTSAGRVVKFNVSIVPSDRSTSSD